MANELEQLVLKKAQAWLDGHYDEATKKQVKYLIDNDMKELTESFYKDLEIGTGGLRGIMGVGTNRMNVYTVGAATQGLPFGCGRDRLAQPQGVQRLQGLLDGRRAGHRAARQEYHRRSGEDQRRGHDTHG